MAFINLLNQDCLSNRFGVVGFILVYKHRAAHKLCPETLLALFGAFAALRVI